MDFGVFLDFSRRKGSTQAEIFREAFELVDIAEETGLDTIWLGESHFNPNRSVMSAPALMSSIVSTVRSKDMSNWAASNNSPCFASRARTGNGLAVNSKC